MNIATRLLLASLAAASAQLCIGAPPVPPKIEIKGIKIGDSKDQVDERFPHLAAFSVGEVFSKYSGGPSVQYKDGRLVSLIFLFDAERFDDVLSTVRSKYPKTRCSSSSVTNGFGATFEQIDCEYVSGGDVLTMSRFVSDISTSSLSLHSRAWIKERTAESKKKYNDI